MKISGKYLYVAAAYMALVAAPAVASSMTSTTTLSAHPASAGSIGFSYNDRDAINEYLTELPSGVSASTGGQYRVGETLPGNAPAGTLPANVASQIQPAPSGYTYVQSGTDVYLVDRSNRRIIDRVGIR